MINIIKIFIVLIIININLLAQEFQWKKIKSPTNQRLTKLSVVDSMHLWACGDTGTIVNSTDAGKTWILQNSNTISDIRNIQFINENLGWAIYWQVHQPPFGTTLLKTTDGGISWIAQQFKETERFFHQIKFYDSLNGWLVGENGLILRTVDGGNEWREMEIAVSPFSRLPVLDIEFYNSQYGIACGGHMDLAGIIWRTTDSGLSWKGLVVGPEPIQNIIFLDSMQIYGLGGDYEYGSSIIYSNDSGNTFEYTSLEIFGIPSTLAFRTNSEVWSSLGIDPYFMKSLDTGKTFILYKTPDSSKIDDIYFIDSTKGFAVGRKGIILKYEKGNFTNQDFNDKSLVFDFYLAQNYPNPFNPSTIINYSLPVSIHISISVYDLFGRKVQTLVDEIKKAGKYSIEWNATGFAAGIYYYELNTGNFRKIKKMILLK